MSAKGTSRLFLFTVEGYVPALRVEGPIRSETAPKCRSGGDHRPWPCGTWGAVGESVARSGLGRGASASADADVRLSDTGEAYT
jgi:hypothetical protein